MDNKTKKIHTYHLEMYKPSGSFLMNFRGPGGMIGTPIVITPKTLSGYARANKYVGRAPKFFSHEENLRKIYDQTCYIAILLSFYCII